MNACNHLKEQIFQTKRRIFVPMKRLRGIAFIIIIISVSMLFSAYAQDKVDPGEQITLTEFMNITWDGTETVSFYMDTEAYEVDTNLFFELSDRIMLTDIEDRVFNSGNKNGILGGVLYITILKEDEMISFAAISAFGEVDRYGMFMSRLPCAAFEMKAEDLHKLYDLLPEEAQGKIQVVFESSNTDLNGGIEPEKNVINQDFLADYNGYIIVTIIAVSALAVIGIIVKLVLFKCKK